MTSTKDWLWETPAWFLYEVLGRNGDPQGQFLHLNSPAKYAQFPFHFPSAVQPRLPQRYPLIAAKWRALRDDAHQRHGTCHYIFHMTLGGSSLLCRCLECLPQTTVIKEATPLTDLVALRPQSGSPTEVESWMNDLRTVHRLYARTFVQPGIAIHKPMHLCNELLPTILSIDTNCRALYLYQSPDAFLASILRNPERRRNIRGDLRVVQQGVTANPAKGDLVDKKAVASARADNLKDAEAIAVFWISSLFHAVEETENSNLGERLRFVNSAQLFGRPSETAIQACTHFCGRPIEVSATFETLCEAAMKTNAKLPHRRFDEAARIQQQRCDFREFRAEIDQGLRHLRSVCRLEQVFSRIAARSLPVSAGGAYDADEFYSPRGVAL